MSLFAVKNDKGEWLYSDEYNDWVDQLSLASFYDTFEEANDDIECWELSNAYVVELTEKPAPVVVSEEEADMLRQAKGSLNPALTIYAHCKTIIGPRAENRLMRAYVNSWTVAKPKLFNVKVPHVDAAYYMKLRNGRLTANSVFGNKDRSQQFTAAEIEHYGLGDCQKVEVKQDEI